MARHNDIGQRGEALAQTYLHNAGFEILEQNWRHSKAEVDLIAKDGAILVFIEVKTRSYTYFGQPESFVTLKKKQLLAKAASVYMEQIGHDWEIRFDVVSVILPEGKPPQIQHFPDAFFPGLD